MCTTVSTSWPVITFAITGLRMSARTKATLPRSPRGGTTSTPMTRSTPGSAASRRANRPPKSRETPVTRTTRPTSALPSVRRRGYLPWRRRWMRVFFSSLRCFFLAIRFRRFLTTEPTPRTFRLRRRPGADVLASDSRGQGIPPAPARSTQPNRRTRGGETLPTARAFTGGTPGPIVKNRTEVQITLKWHRPDDRQSFRKPLFTPRELGNTSGSYHEPTRAGHAEGPPGGAGPRYALRPWEGP